MCSQQYICVRGYTVNFVETAVLILRFCLRSPIQALRGAGDFTTAGVLYEGMYKAETVGHSLVLLFASVYFGNPQ